LSFSAPGTLYSEELFVMNISILHWSVWEALDYNFAAGIGAVGSLIGSMSFGPAYNYCVLEANMNWGYVQQIPQFSTYAGCNSWTAIDNGRWASGATLYARSMSVLQYELGQVRLVPTDPLNTDTGPFLGASQFSIAWLNSNFNFTYAQ
jgi:hypothetical protein